MSRFDYPDPGTDPAYCDGLSDGMFDDGGEPEQMDSTEAACQNALDACDDLTGELAKVSSASAAWEMRKHCTTLERKFTELSKQAAAKLDVFLR